MESPFGMMISQLSFMSSSLNFLPLICLQASTDQSAELWNVPGILLLQDFRKAFDIVEGPFIQQTLSKFNIGNSVRCWIQTFYCNAESSIYS